MSGNIFLAVLGAIAAVAIIASIVYVTPVVLALIIAVAIGVAFFMALTLIGRAADDAGTATRSIRTSRPQARTRGPGDRGGERESGSGAPASGEGAE